MRSIVIVVAALVLLGGAYGGGYFLRTEVWDLDPTDPHNHLRYRRFANRWEEAMWAPMMAAESYITGKNVGTPPGIIGDE